ncbi:MAG: FG-GAP-like repeat-containing protein [Deltaproteobacteria bacterium]|nr:FG-GAP-like repeat-containing protein [Deltaproteobacteria bacterium]
MNIFKNKYVRTLCILIILIIGLNLNSAFAKQFRVAIIPFKINAEKDMTFLKDGVFDMLSSRLFSGEKVEIVGRQETEKIVKSIEGILTEGKARKIGAKLEANYVLFGSLTIFGDSVSIDAKIVDVTGDKEALAFFNQTRGIGEVILEINTFAEDINEKVFGQVMSSKKLPAKQQLQPVQTDNIYAHPEKLVEDFEDTGKKSDLNPAVIVNSPQKSSREFWKSRNFRELINGIALGDVDCDGKVETVIITPDSVHIYRFENNQLSKIMKIDEDKYKIFIGVDVADINNNGYPEIFITSLNPQRNVINSIVFEYDGKNYNKIVDSCAWYYRVAEIPGNGIVLFGQKQKTGGPDTFSSEIFEMAWNNTEYVPDRKVLPSNRANLMGFCLGDVMNDGRETVVAYDKSDYIRIINQSGRVLWTGDAHYGGSTHYFEMPAFEPGSDNRQYYPMKIIITDIDSDGKYEVIAVKNHELTGRLLKQLRKFKEAQIESLSWNGLGLATNWKTAKISGYIRDFAIGDFDNDGENEITAAVVSKEGSIIGTRPKSSVISYDLKKAAPN